jgi:hypothetical protein
VQEVVQGVVQGVQAPCTRQSIMSGAGRCRECGQHAGTPQRYTFKIRGRKVLQHLAWVGHLAAQLTQLQLSSAALLQTAARACSIVGPAYLHDLLRT